MRPTIAIGIMLVMLMVWPRTGLAAEGRFSFEQAAAEAGEAAKTAFVQEKEIPDFLKNINYDQLRDIRFKDADTLWASDKVPFKVRFFHPGFYYRWPVSINYVDESGVHPYLFSPGLFDYGKNDFKDKIPPDLGFAGFRIHYPINSPDHTDEIAVFLGASYFRALGKNEVYGMSARGLAIDTALDTGEEFPFFKKFWIIKPAKDDKSITVYALLDSVSATGAYKFVIQPGEETVMQVRCRLFFRKPVAKLGLAPLTSMYFYGENSSPSAQDGFRPEVHDSDGLFIHTRSGEWIWRPLINPKELLVNTFEVGTPRGFGLFQRDTNFDRYQDLESRYDLRPSVWVEPGGDWGQGHVELLQIPSDKEQNDNINAYWVPQKQPQAGDRMDLSYTLTWGPARDQRPDNLGYVTATRIQPGENNARFEIDFEGKAINAIHSNQDIAADITVSQGYTLKEQQLFKNTVTGGWRLVFQIQFEHRGGSAIGLRAFLKNANGLLTETWDYAYSP